MHKKNTRFLLWCLFFVFTANIALAQPANDNCSNAIEIAIPENGYGIGTLFKALAHDAGDLRFRSGDHAMSIRGDRPSLTGRVEIVQKAWLDGLVVSVRCASNDLAQGVVT